MAGPASSDSTLFGCFEAPCGPVCIEGCYSPVFVVRDKPIVIRGFGLLAGEKIILEMADGNDLFEPVNMGCGCCISLTSCNNQLIIPLSGSYRLNRCVCSTDPLSDATVVYEEILTGVVTTTGDMQMACSCSNGSTVTAVTNPNGSVTLVIDGVPTTITPGTPVSASISGTTLLLTVNGVVHQLDLGPDAALTGADIALALGFKDCNGATITANATLATCANLASALAGIPAIPTSLPPSGPAGGALSGTYPNPSLSGSAVATSLGFTSCTGAAINVGATLATCANLTSAIAAIPAGPSSLPPSGAAGGALAGTYPNPTLVPSAVTGLATVPLTNTFGVLIGHIFP